MAALEGLGALPRVGGEEVGVRVGQGHHRQGGLGPLACDLDGRLAEVELGLPWGVAERDEDLLGGVFRPRHGRSDLRGAPRVAVLVTQALVDAPGRVALLGRRSPVVLEDLVVYAQEFTQPGLGAWGVLAIAGRLWVRKVFSRTSALIR